MSEEEKDPKGVRVEDKRTFGEKKEGASPEPSSAQGDEVPEAREGKTGRHRVDFSTLLLSLYSSGLIQMGEMEDPLTRQKVKRLDEAQQAIDILDILGEKTKGNLTREEEELLQQAVTELKMKFVKAVKGQN